MLGRWRKNDGFTWVRYVPTQILMRRRARRERLEQVARDAKDGARQAARKSVAGIEQGVAQAGLAGSALAGGGRQLASASMASAAVAWRRSGMVLGALLPRLAAAIRSADRRSLLAALGGAGLAVLGLSVYLAGWPGIVRAPASSSLWGLQGGLGRPITVSLGQLALIGAGIAVLVVASAWAWRVFGPTLARHALDVLKTRRAADGASLVVNPAAGRAARAGSMAVTAALAAAVVGAGGWGAIKVHSAIMDRGPALTGTAEVLGAQGLRVGQAVIQLAGIAAPDPGQMCGERRQRWRCGDDARRALTRAIAGRSLICRPRGEAESGHVLGQCFDGDADIGAGLVKGGHAWADRDDTLGYRALEEAPKSAKLGIWKAVSEPAWVYRERLWGEAQRAAPDGCPIKAESVGTARVYHLPWSAGYQAVRVARADLARNAKQWFCSEREAREAGYELAPGRGASASGRR